MFTTSRTCASSGKGASSIRSRHTLRGRSDLIIEVISEGNRTHDTVVKYQDYERYGVREYWLVDPRERHIRVYTLEGGRYQLLGVFAPGEQAASRVLEGLAFDPAPVFRTRARGSGPSPGS